MLLCGGVKGDGRRGLCGCLEMGIIACELLVC